MPISLQYMFDTLDTSSLPSATDSRGDIMGKAVPASYFDSNFQKLANAINVQSTEPANPFAGMFWLDTSTNPPTLKQFDGTIWKTVNAETVDGYHASSTPTANTIPVSGSNNRLAFGWLEAFQTLSYGTTINWDLSQGGIAQVTLTGNATLANPTNIVAGGTYILIVKQDSTGGRTLSFGTAYKWPGGTAPTLSSAANAVDIISFVSDGTNMYGVIQKDFK